MPTWRDLYDMLTGMETRLTDRLTGLERHGGDNLTAMEGRLREDVKTGRRWLISTFIGGLGFGAAIAAIVLSLPRTGG